MKLKALVMAGGLGTRMKLKKEKPLIKIYNKTMLERVVEAIKNATKVDETIIVTSKHTPKTTKWARKLGLRVIETPGKGFIHDYKYAIRKLQLKKTLIVSCDLPLVTRAHINYIIKYYEKCRKPALTVAVPLKLYEKMGLKEKYVIKVEDEDVIPIGINIIDGSLINEAEMDEEVLVIEDERLAINVNTINALKVARKFLRQRMYWEKMSIKEACLKLCRQLEKAVRRNLTEAILLSGGVDTSILALIASKYVPLKAFTVAFKKGKPIDVKYATIVADFLDIEHHIYYFSEDELFRALPEVIKVLKTFDPMEVRNSVAIYIALRVVKEHGVNSVMTGDGSDELFAGYSYLLNLNLEELEFELRRMWSIMSFSSKILAKKLKLEVKLPYLDDKFKSFAMKLSSKYKVKVEGERKWGKWILRKAFEKYLPKEVIWRRKAPIEVGSGTAILPKFFETIISDEEFEKKKKMIFKEDNVIIRDKEHLFYYQIYRSTIGKPYSKNLKGRTCPQCHSNISRNVNFCRVCGAYTV